MVSLCQLYDTSRNRDTSEIKHTEHSEHGQSFTQTVKYQEVSVRNETLYGEPLLIVFNKTCSGLCVETFGLSPASEECIKNDKNA